LILLFMGILGLGLLGSLPRLVAAWHQESPGADQSLTDLPVRCDALANHHFAFRRTLLRWHSVVKVSWLGVSSCSKVIVGNHGWLFYSPDPAEHGQAVVRPFQERELAHWQRILEARRDWLARRDVPYLLVIAPDKQSIYPEMLPVPLRPRTATSRLDQLLCYLRAHSDLTVLDLREPLLRAKATEQVYWQTDSHWNGRGALVAYEQIMAGLAEWFPAAGPLPRSAFAPAQHDVPGGDLARMLQLRDRMHEDWLGYQPLRPQRARPSPEQVAMNERGRLAHLQPAVWEGTEKPGLRAVMFFDSFGEALMPLLAEHFQRIVYVPTNGFDVGVVARECPQVVIQELVERSLNRTLPADPDLPARAQGVQASARISPNSRASLVHEAPPSVER
jgi:hypothetical protein